MMKFFNFVFDSQMLVTKKTLSNKMIPSFLHEKEWVWRIISSVQFIKTHSRLNMSYHSAFAIRYSLFVILFLINVLN